MQTLGHWTNPQTSSCIGLYQTAWFTHTPHGKYHFSSTSIINPKYIGKYGTGFSGRQQKGSTTINWVSCFSIVFHLPSIAPDISKKLSCIYFQLTFSKTDLVYCSFRYLRLSGKIIVCNYYIITITIFSGQFLLIFILHRSKNDCKLFSVIFFCRFSAGEDTAPRRNNIPQYRWGIDLLESSSVEKDFGQ